MIPEYLGFTFWAMFGLVYLGILTYQDFKHNKLVDDRYNYYMKGITTFLILFSPEPLYYRLAVYLLAAPVIWFLLKRFSPLGAGDVKSIVWSFVGLALLGIYPILLYFIIILVLTAVYSLLKKLIIKDNKPFQYYPVLLSSFFLTCWLLGLLF